MEKKSCDERVQIGSVSMPVSMKGFFEQPPEPKIKISAEMKHSIGLLAVNSTNTDLIGVIKSIIKFEKEDVRGYLNWFIDQLSIKKVEKGDLENESLYDYYTKISKN